MSVTRDSQLGLTMQRDIEKQGKEDRTDIEQINASLPGLVWRKGDVSGACVCVFSFFWRW